MSKAREYLLMVATDCGISAAAQDDSLQEHDDKFHNPNHEEHGHFDPETMRCGKREGMEKGDDGDADIVSALPKHHDNCITPEQDAAYADAVKRGDNETALRMIREAAAKAMPNTKVVGEDGLPKVMWHGSGDAKFSVFEKGDIGFHFGSWTQALQRNYMTVDHEGVIREFFVDVKSPLVVGGDARNWNGNGIAKYFLTEKDVVNDNSNFGMVQRGWRSFNPFNELDAELDKIAKMGNAESNAAMRKLMSDNGYDGIVYENEVEGNADDGTDSWIAFSPSQIKSADITYDDSGNLIPLSKRFNMESADIRDEAKGNVKKYLEAVETEDEARSYLRRIDPYIPKKVVRKRRKPIDRIPKKLTKQIIVENCKLIKTIDEKMLPLVAGKVYGMLTGKVDPEDFIDWCMDECGLEEWQAYRIARDQIVKAQEAIKLADWKKRGVNFVMWCHSDKDKEPREYHNRQWDGHSGVNNGNPQGLDGFLFRIGDWPVIDKKTGVRGTPSQLIGCKCYLRAIFGA